jgi:sugar lactone lactonase YvrE
VAGRAGDFGTSDGSSQARFSDPTGLAADRNGTLWVTDRSSSTIRHITRSGNVTTVAGVGFSEGSADGSGKSARFRFPAAIAPDGRGNAYVADWGNSTIRKISSSGSVSTFAGMAMARGSQDGTGNAARFDAPGGIAVDESENVYVADTGNHTIRKITPSRVVTTFAGMAGSQGSKDGVGTEARFSYPRALAFDRGGNLYVADGNAAIRKITPAGEVTTVAGRSGAPGTLDGTGSDARFLSPVGIAVDATGIVYVADSESGAIRKGSPSISDRAAIDVPSGPVWVSRQLDILSPAGSAWEWRVIRRPADSRAELSDTTARNPTFTPDVAGLYTIRLLATGMSGLSLSTVDLTAMNPSPRPRRRSVRP